MTSERSRDARARDSLSFATRFCNKARAELQVQILSSFPFHHHHHPFPQRSRSLQYHTRYTMGRWQGGPLRRHAISRPRPLKKSIKATSKSTNPVPSPSPRRSHFATQAKNLIRRRLEASRKEANSGFRPGDEEDDDGEDWGGIGAKVSTLFDVCFSELTLYSSWIVSPYLLTLARLPARLPNQPFVNHLATVRRRLGTLLKASPQPNNASVPCPRRSKSSTRS